MIDGALSTAHCEPEQGGTTAQHKAAGPKQGKATAKTR
jgi:hypothetical protein